MAQPLVMQYWRAIRVLFRVAPPRRWASRLLDSGLFDRRYYELQAQRQFSDDEEAVRHFLAASPLHRYSFHPLMEPAWIARALGEGAMPWHAAVFRDRRLRSTGPLFDLGNVRSDQLKLPFPPVTSALSAFDNGFPDSTPVLPSFPTPSVPARGRTRDVLYQLAGDTALQISRASRRNSLTWDWAVERAYLDELDRSSDSTKPAPVVSVILPTFNRANALADAVESVRAQTIAAWELIIVDDGSTDSTGGMLAHWSATDARIHVIRQTNAGVSAARNAGLDFASGEYIAFLDSDNVWGRDFLRVSLAALNRSGRLVSYCAVELRLDRNQREYLGAPATHQDLLDGRNQVDLNALVTHRDVISKVGRFDVSLRRWVDYDLVLRISREYELEYVPVIGVLYDHRASAGDRITTTQTSFWRDVVLEKNLVDWKRLANESRVDGRLSVLIRTRGEWSSTLRTIRAVLDDADGADAEVIVVDNGSPRDESAILTAAFLGDPRVRIHRVAGDLRLPTSTNLAFALSTGGVLAVVKPDASLHPGWITRIRQAVNADAEGLAGVESIGIEGVLLAALAEPFISRRGLDPMPVDGAAGPDECTLRRATDSDGD
jgi:glycosyltransferase involved in cell wall biosynthesis